MVTFPIAGKFKNIPLFHLQYIFFQIKDFPPELSFFFLMSTEVKLNKVDGLQVINPFKIKLLKKERNPYIGPQG